MGEQKCSEATGPGFELRYRLYIFFLHFIWLWVGPKGSEATCREFEPRYRQYFLQAKWMWVGQMSSEATCRGLGLLYIYI